MTGRLCGRTQTVVSLLAMQSGVFVLSVSAITASRAGAEVVVTFSKVSWESMVGGPNTKLGFNDLTVFPNPIVFTDQYASFGVTATQGDDLVLWGAFQDQRGLFGRYPTGPGDPSITLAFAAPIHSVGFRALSGLSLDLYSGETQVASGVILGPFHPPEKFAGLHSTIAFDRVHLKSTAGPADAAVIDDLYFETIPAPGGFVVMLAVCAGGRRRRR